MTEEKQHYIVPLPEGATGARINGVFYPRDALVYNPAKTFKELYPFQHAPLPPRIIRVPVEHPRTITVECKYDGVKYHGILTEVEEKYEESASR